MSLHAPQFWFKTDLKKKPTTNYPFKFSSLDPKQWEAVLLSGFIFIILYSASIFLLYSGVELSTKDKVISSCYLKSSTEKRYRIIKHKDNPLQDTKNLGVLTYHHGYNISYIIKVLSFGYIDKLRNCQSGETSAVFK